ncbi:hypothetical protein FHW58_003358 [Duganella sp. 1224]|uniref:FxDxF family PEP-CTERM protein n=1 Tax=Duganella sp. 1224 TaxID=2587052 RepID=UPI0015C6E54C|nr:FxDxF family PEP-CTERM protein [Duganella sp. 1224]NYE62143.1 hypothetical protein [Duganella sp. 1224]
MKLKTYIGGALLAAASFGASAATVDLGSLDPTTFDSTGQSIKHSAIGYFYDTITFTLATDSLSSFGALQTFAAPSKAITGFGGELVGHGSFTGPTTSADDSQQSLSWKGGLGVGTYTIHIWGTTTALNTSYVATVSALPVPEPETYGLMLGGLALVGAIARRKAKGKV